MVLVSVVTCWHPHVDADCSLNTLGNGLSSAASAPALPMLRLVFGMVFVTRILSSVMVFQGESTAGAKSDILI